eukprot:Lankesteria_metandrocarpae@DN4272_c0_g1_i1.p1
MSNLFETLRGGPLKVAVLGGGSWGTTIAKLVAENAAASYIYDDDVMLWVYDEPCGDESLIQTMNNAHENKLYLPGVDLPHNLRATGDLAYIGKEATLLVFVCPHQFLKPLCHNLVGKIRPECRAISLIKGCFFTNNRPELCSSVIQKLLNIDCSVLSGANVAKDIALGQFSETTIGYRDPVVAAVWQQLFDRPYFRVSCIPDVHGVELCGAVKNVVALSAGFCDGLGVGTNTKAAIIRLGVDELRTFASFFFDGILEETFFDSAGYADVITTCFGGRNVLAAKEFVVRKGKSSWEDIERDLLKGQKLQGHLSCKEVYDSLKANQLLDHFPLFVITYKIAFENAPAEDITLPFQSKVKRHIKAEEECNPCIVPLALKGIRRKFNQERQHSV